jgi:hypothetical protein
MIHIHLLPNSVVQRNHFNNQLNTLFCLQFRDENSTEIGSKFCNIIGSDGGTIPYARQHYMPSTGLMVEVAYRWDVVCDFSSFNGTVWSCLASRGPAWPLGCRAPALNPHGPDDVC